MLTKFGPGKKLLFPALLGLIILSSVGYATGARIAISEESATQTFENDPIFTPPSKTTPPAPTQLRTGDLAEEVPATSPTTTLESN